MGQFHAFVRFIALIVVLGWAATDSVTACLNIPLRDSVQVVAYLGIALMALCLIFRASYSSDGALEDDDLG